MAHFTKAYLQFFADLTQHNEREWFHANKKRYEEHVKNPFKNFVQLLIDQMQVIDPSIIITPKDAIFRINRDIRFSKDKTPYKTNASAAISAGGRKDHSKPGIYIEMGSEQFGIYSGVYMPDKNQLQAIREAIAAEPDTFKKILKTKKFKDFWGKIQGERNKRIPKEFAEAAEDQPLIFNKQFYVVALFAADKILDPQLDKIVMDHYRAAKPLSDFFYEAIHG
ncbi:MAG: DUF2461 domain-containing protein [Bacteroidota bacterium]